VPGRLYKLHNYALDLTGKFGRLVWGYTISEHVATIFYDTKLSTCKAAPRTPSLQRFGEKRKATSLPVSMDS
jgi:hypothetical protein